MREKFRTVKGEGTAEIVEKKSKFISYVKRVSSEDEALEYYESIKKKNWDARHNVYAYYINEGLGVQKFTDDGEPAGTAGMPMLETIKKHGLEDVVIVITRYFGGILLGTGGLVRAYSKAAGEGILKAGTVEIFLSEKYHLKIDYSMLGKIQSAISENGWRMIDIKYSDLIDIYFAVPINETGNLPKILNELSAGTLAAEKMDQGYYIIDEIV